MMRLLPTMAGNGLAAALSGMALLTGCATAATVHTAAVSSPKPSPARCTGAAPGAAVAVGAMDAVQFVSAQQGWVAGAGRILATSNGGRTWVQQYDGSAQLDQIDFTDAQHGWAVGTDSLLRTTDGGATWTAGSDPCGSIRSVHFVTPDVGYAVDGGSQVRVDGGLPASAVGGELLATTDGGQSWQAVAGAPAQAQTACFSSQADGFVGTPGKIWRTSDAGRHWSLAFAEPPVSTTVPPQVPDTTVLECAGNTAVWALFLGSGAALGHAPYLAYATQNASTATPNATTMHPLFEESYIESSIRPEVHAPDGPGSYPGPFSAISPDDAAFIGWNPAVGYGTAPLDTMTGGSSLSRQGNVTGITQAYGVAFVSATQGWVVGTNAQTGEYSIEATANGGHTWTSQYQIR